MAEPKKRLAKRAPDDAPDDPLVAHLAAFFAARPLSLETHLCVALSGGCDSVVLLHALGQLIRRKKILARLSALHVHHGLSPQADAWADFCEGFCAQQAIPLEVVRVSVPRASGAGLEAAARRARYAVFSASPADALLLAHHRDDQAETVLLNLLRGAGVAGAAAMLPERASTHGPRLLRPLLEWPRAHLNAYAKTHDLPWIEDESNDDLHFRRNFLRHEILPKMSEKFASAPSALARAARHFAEAATLLDELAALDRQNAAASSGRLQLAALKALSPARARNLLRSEWLRAGFQAPSTRWLEEALRQLAATNADSETCVETTEGRLQLYRGELYFLPQTSAAATRSAQAWAGETRLSWGQGSLSLLPVIGLGVARRWLVEGEVFIHPRQGGERLQPDAKRPRRSVRKLCQDLAIPPWQRAQLPFLWCAGRLLWVAGLGVDAEFACAPGEDGLLLTWTAGESAE